jgi:toxin ParE1/3/4
VKAEYSSAANRDVKRAIDYYHREAGAEVAERFISKLEAKVLTILEHPASYRVVTRDLRCVNLDRFPYQIVYRIVDDERIKIISVRHHKQHPDFGLDR